MGRPYKIVIINKSDTTGGAAVVSFRLLEALRREGAEAGMLVAEKKSDSLHVRLAASKIKIKINFLLERLRIFIDNGFNRSTLFKIDTGEMGLPLWRNQLVKEADAVLINWVNQGMLSLKGISKILKSGKAVIWTMHDMWCMTGICHHAYSCIHFHKQCGNCHLLGKNESSDDLSHKVWKIKSNLYNNAKESGKRFSFVAVSSWLMGKGLESSLLKTMPVEVIPNPFDIPENPKIRVAKDKESEIIVLFGAARLDDPIKGLPVLKEMSGVIASRYPETARRLKIVTFGSVKDPAALEGFCLPLENSGILNAEEVRKAYERADILISASHYETLPGTLVEAQAYGCIPVSFNQGGQSDIVDHKVTGYLAEISEDLSVASKNLADGVVWAISQLEDSENYQKIILKMRENIKAKFSYNSIARQYIELIDKLLCKNGEKSD
ncbi:MAG: glycosyltransferase [Muribaculaceae bacterium]|nr:glycosyltransferase [Muribaculaceae bacterium]